jgi:hypothetical protein
MQMFPHYAESQAFVRAAPDVVFAYVDDQARLSSHMTKPSWWMGGGSMRVEADDGGGMRAGSHLRLSGTAFGIALALDEVVTKHLPPHEKAWETVGAPALLVIGAYRMGFEIDRVSGGSSLRVFIEYRLPASGIARVLGAMFGGLYARWCVRRMARDAAAHFAAVPSAKQRTAVL